jgi:hypothetical protein
VNQKEFHEFTLDLVDRRRVLNDAALNDYFAILDNARYWLLREKEQRASINLTGELTNA